MATVSRRSGAWKAWNTCVCLVGQILIGSLSLGTKFGKMYFITHTALPIWLGMHFSGFQYAAHYMALMATWGSYGQHAGNQSLPPISTSVEARPQQSGSESDEAGSSYTSGSSRGCMAELLADRQRADEKAEASVWSEGCGGT